MLRRHWQSWRRQQLAASDCEWPWWGCGWQNKLVTVGWLLCVNRWCRRLRDYTIRRQSTPTSCLISLHRWALAALDHPAVGIRIFFYAAVQEALSDDAVWRLSVWSLTSIWRLTSVAYIRSAGGVCVLADRARIGRPGSRLPLRASVAVLGGAYRGGRPPTACFLYLQQRCSSL